MKAKVALAQCKSIRYNKEANIKHAEDIIKEASEKGSEIILFPEMFTTGYLIKPKIDELAEPADGYTSRKFSELAKKFKIAIIFGFPEKDEKSGIIYNSACFIDKDGTIRGVYRKTHLFGDGDKSMFSPGDKLFAFDTSFGRVGMIICYDVEFPETSRIVAIDGAKIIFMISANMFPYEDYHVSYMKVRAMENCVYTVSSNAVGQEDDFVYCGRSVAFSPEGKQLCCGSLREEELLIVELDMSKVHSADPTLNYLNHRRTDIYQNICK